MTRTLDSRWVIKRYKTFIFIGLVILVIQLHLAYFAINSNSDQEKPNVDNQQKDKSAVFDNVIDENSARQVKDNYNVDDEDNDPPDKVNVEIKNFLEFAPPCEISGKEAISSIRRAKTQKCKQTLVNVTCLLQNGRLYPDTLPNYCPKKNLLAGKLLGCYKDEKTYRLLSGYYANYKSTNSPEHCIRMCLQSGFVYAGVQYSSECFCGNDEPPSTARLPDPSCNMKCPANPKEACGGYFTINIYQTGIAQFVAQTAETSTESEAVPVRIAFLLTMNGRASRQIYRLIKALFHVDHYFYIHVDARQDYLYRELLTLEKKFPNIILARERYATIWGGASLLQMLLSSMRKLLSLDWQWDFIINLSESDFPVKTTEKLVEFLTANRNRNFVKSHGREVQRFIQKQGLDKTFVECDAHMWRTGDRKIPWGIQIDGGSDWVALSRDFVKYVSTEKPDPLIEGLLTFFKYTLLPAESFFHTALRNSKYCNTYIDNNLHVTNWKRRLGCKCQYKHVVDWCGCSPNDFKPDDWPRIQATEARQLYFARKFEPVINQAVILQLEQWLFGPHPLDVVNIDSYWQSVYHYADLSPAPDDALITIANSLARMLLQNNSCKIKSVSVIEVFSYHQNDIYKGSIINFNAIVDESKLQLEVWVKPVNNLQVGKTTKTLLKRLKTFYVSSDYDQKEQLSRNFGRFLGPHSDPVLIYEFLPSLLNNAKSQNVSFLWIDSAGRLADVSEASIDIVYVMNTVKLNAKQPLLPGVWTVKLVHEKTFLAQCTFLITPLEFLSKKPISQTESVFVNGGSTSTHAFSNRWDAFLKNKTERDALQTISKFNTKRYGADLREWIDSLVSKSYKFVQSCIINFDNVNNFVKLCESDLSSESCLNTVWSSKAPDPKSFIGLVNSTTGRLNRF